ncbi:hypothetical protein JCM8547_004488 [Rhodosporidiobolus lusitaniae]
MAKTLCALSLTHRRWTSPAIRALYADPTKSLRNWHQDEAAWLLIDRILKRPQLGAYARSLDRLASLQGVLLHSGTSVEVLQAQAWTVALLRDCPNVTSLSVSPAADDLDYIDELKGLRYLRRVTVRAAYDDITIDEGSTVTYFNSLQPLPCKTVVFKSCCFDGFSAWPDKASLAAVKRLELLGVCLHPADPSENDLDLDRLENLVFWSYSNQLDYDGILPLLRPTLVSLSIFVANPFNPPPSGLLDDYDHYVEQADLPALPALPNLKHLQLEHFYLDLSVLAILAKQCPLLETLHLPHCAWEPWGWEDGESGDDAVQEVILSLPHLTSLSLGWVPIYENAELRHTSRLCRRSRIKLDFAPCLSLPSSASESCDDSDSAESSGTPSSSSSRSSSLTPSTYDRPDFSLASFQPFPSPSSSSRSPSPLPPSDSRSLFDWDPLDRNPDKSYIEEYCCEGWSSEDEETKVKRS